ncbi:MAG: methionine--tRNA ligase [Coriobacteriia bacterium]|nr:methionine--tRNA ligase [Coriobacteriia bacterium]
MIPNRSSYYLTTPIYYVNDVPHLGTAYTTIAADVMARYRRMSGHDVVFLTGLDEHGQKIEQAATAAGYTPQEWVDKLAPAFKETWEMLGISYDIFMRTTSDEHRRAVQEFARRLYDSGDIYSGSYEGWYCVPDEAYWAPGDLDMEDVGDGKEDAVPNCPDCSRSLQFVREKNWFFRLSNYADFLLQWYADNPQALQPETRRNEILSFIRSGLHDLSISRANVKWGIPLPWTEGTDDAQTMYVWFDALINYLTGIGFGADDEASAAEFAYRWPAQVHYVGKDITRFHCIIWPAMLYAAGLPLPQQVFAHGFLLTKGEKMSKSKGNAKTPRELVERLGVDGYRYYFLRDVVFGSDGSISDEAMVQRFNGDLANDWGNLVSRLFSMVGKYCDEVVPAYVGDPLTEGAEGAVLRDIADGLFEQVEDAYNRFDYSGALKEIWELVRAANRYLEDSAPWGLAKNADSDLEAAARLANVLYSALEAVRTIALFTAPTMPATADEVMSRLELSPATTVVDLQREAQWGQLPAGNKVTKGDPLFQRLDV